MRQDFAQRRFPIGSSRAAKRNWSAIAIADSTGKQLTFGETLTAALLLKTWIRPIAPASRCVGLLLPSSVGGALANLGVTLAGKTAVNLNFTAGEEAMAHAIDKCEIATILSSRAFLEKAKLAPTAGHGFPRRPARRRSARRRRPGRMLAARA